jgi:hypothetical protein
MSDAMRRSTGDAAGRRELVADGAGATGELPTFGEHACYNI